MKALSLTQPWASLVAVGAKLVETRSWSTAYRGPIAIHAAKGFPPYARCTAMLPQFQKPLIEAGYHLRTKPFARGVMPLEHTLPLGAVIATARLVGCKPTEQVRKFISMEEIGFGDYDDGRWAWVLADVEALVEPMPAVGALGLWEWLPEFERVH